MKINSVPDVKRLFVIKMCYVYNQWYDISWATLYFGITRHIRETWYKASSDCTYSMDNYWPIYTQNKYVEYVPSLTEIRLLNKIMEMAKKYLQITY